MREGPLLLVLLGAPGLVSLLVLAAVLFPRRVGAAQRAAASMPGRSLLLGAVNLLFLGALVTVLTAASERAGAARALLQILALPPAVALTAGLLLGVSAVAALAGARLAAARGPIAQLVIGSASLVLGSLTPLVGWFLFFPYIALLGLGGVVIGLFGRAPATSE